MSFFTDAEALWIEAGGPPDQAAVAAAIAATESSNGTRVYGDQAYSANGEDPTSFGYWQIHTFDKHGLVHTLPNGQPYDDHRLATDPLYDAQAAVAVYNAGGHSFRPWSTYRTEAFYENLAAGTGKTLAQVKAGDYGPTPTAPGGEVPRPPATHPTSGAPPAQPTSHALHEGSRGAAVADVQAAVGVAIDGVYGRLTEAAVRTYQGAHGLTVDGVVGPRTQAAFARDARRLVREGSTGAEVVGIQEQVGVTPDGVYGPKTVAAVERFQKAHRLDADGVVGPETRAALTRLRHAEFGHDAAPPHATAPPAPAHPAAPPTVGTNGPPGWTPAPAPAGTEKFLAPDLQSFERQYRADATHTDLRFRYDETSHTLTASFENARHEQFVSTVRTSDPKTSFDELDGHGSVTLAPGTYVIAGGRHQSPTRGEGPAFTQVLNANGTDGLKDTNGEIHTQIGLHGGGAGIPNPQDPLQPLTGTAGCIRLHNVDAATVASLSIEVGRPIPFQIQGRAPRAVEVQDAALRLRSEGGPSLPAVANVVPWDGKRHVGTIVAVDADTVAQNVGRGEYVLYDVNHDFKGKPPAEGRSVTVDAKGHVQTSHAEPPVHAAHR